MAERQKYSRITTCLAQFLPLCDEESISLEHRSRRWTRRRSDWVVLKPRQARDWVKPKPRPSNILELGWSLSDVVEEREATCSSCEKKLQSLTCLEVHQVGGSRCPILGWVRTYLVYIDKNHDGIYDTHIPTIHMSYICIYVRICMYQGSTHASRCYMRKTYETSISDIMLLREMSLIKINGNGIWEHLYFPTHRLTTSEPSPASLR